MLFKKKLCAFEVCNQVIFTSQVFLGLMLVLALTLLLANSADDKLMTFFVSLENRT